MNVEDCNLPGNCASENCQKYLAMTKHAISVFDAEAMMKNFFHGEVPEGKEIFKSDLLEELKNFACDQSRVVIHSDFWNTLGNDDIVVEIMEGYKPEPGTVCFSVASIYGFLNHAVESSFRICKAQGAGGENTVVFIGIDSGGTPHYMDLTYLYP